ncbi:hypothetical protein OHA40_03335 [Nocardia sp. NBC_00508]|uniref:hypothetical protein n=1 Tax=Nocardia sp. NBC_00508 TaxID=2975992 RepID=UPI002E811345|nr:hypothetical protein [Nocardia sp. NBC_00508]WUD67209.1 hypothetical protein OHA40_03335 [Nocardia sp. NBC_00508]
MNSDRFLTSSIGNSPIRSGGRRRRYCHEKLYPDGDFGILNERAEVAAHLWRAVSSDADGVAEVLRWLSNDPAAHG